MVMDFVNDFHLYAVFIWPEKRPVIVLSFNIKKIYHCGFARNITLSLKSMMQGEVLLMNMNQMMS